MNRPGHLLEDKALAEFLGVEDVDFDSGSDTEVEEEEQSKPSTPVRGDIPHPAPNPFPERSAATALTALGAMSPMDTSIITNPLDEEQQRMLDQAASTQRKSEVQTTLQRHSEYTFTPPDVEELIRQASRHNLATWATGPEAKTPTEIECRKALRERYLEPTVRNSSQFRKRLQKQAQGAPVPQIRGIPIIISEDGDETAEDNMFIRWVHGVRRLSCSATRKCQCGRPANSRQPFDTNSPALTTTSEKRGARQDELGPGAQKRQLRMGGLAEGESHTPMSFQTQGTHATSPDIGSDHDEDVVKVPATHGTLSSLAYQAMPVAVGVSAESHGELVKKVEDLRGILGQTQNAVGEVRSRLATLEGDHARLQMMESRQTRGEAQLDISIRMQHPVATPMYAAQAPSSQHGTGPGMA
uniref:Uncharacterized protein n=2 Tax=Peronospora matthiolae TaxID=2874970 RepID=A0AAV1UC53_9STRA